jgi:hypothetical protein
MTVKLIIPEDLVGDIIDRYHNKGYGPDNILKWSCFFLPEINEWIQDNIREKSQVKVALVWRTAARNDSRYDIVITFGTDNDAIFFKMRWL